MYILYTLIKIYNTKYSCTIYALVGQQEKIIFSFYKLFNKEILKGKRDRR